mmetsp:Transcript_13705/g.20050  ORF Transcript_13705/g.20050 Transcript_13705/m.20050 type:complete len:113 (+) Transcript_13705:399-737(+)
MFECMTWRFYHYLSTKETDIHRIIKSCYYFHASIFLLMRGPLTRWWIKTPSSLNPLNTPKLIHTPVSPYIGGNLLRASNIPSVATIVLIDSCKKLPVPTITPSPMKTNPFTH